LVYTFLLGAAGDIVISIAGVNIVIGRGRRRVQGLPCGINTFYCLCRQGKGNFTKKRKLRQIVQKADRKQP